MILDLDTLPADAEATDPRLQADVCIVGGGAVGLVLACALADRGVRVLVLEGGGPTLEVPSQALQRGSSVGHPFQNIEVGRYRVLGGTTTYWGGQLYPFDSFVTGARPWLGHAAWPLAVTGAASEDLSDPLGPWFAQAYTALGLGDALLADAQVWPALGQAVPDLGADLALVTTRWVKTRNFAKLFGPRLRQAHGPHVLTHANVTALDMDAPARQVQSATVRSLGGRTLQLRARRFVLANGALEIARLLLHPLADGRVAPWSGSAWIGRPLIDHLDAPAATVQVLDHQRFHDLFDSAYVRGHKYYPRLRLAPATQAREGLVDCSAQFVYRTRFSAHLDYLKMFLRSVRDGSGGVSLGEMPRHAAALAATAWPLAKRYFRDRRSFKPHDAEVTLVLSCEQLPSGHSRLTLGDERDALGLRRLRVDWQIDGRELRSMRRFTQIVGQELEARGLARLVMDPALQAEDAGYLTQIIDAVHQMGTVRMGASRDDGAVDGDLRLFDTDNLFVAGAATFPSTGFANPTFTAIALALRLADQLARATPHGGRA